MYTRATAAVVLAGKDVEGKARMQSGLAKCLWGECVW